ncbi:MAG: hypothetical protein N0C88_03940 [Candidatus Thiodiazotropha lotti]|uniref:DUF2157 domain-containing protein n=1 Tax=Candidatus Thiodiazotropha lotti TaxID=2792787 RepID=A0A9E4K1N1_9GAMM|nr:hypothetical protein [Candidatus Thiodiazotropha lotti]ODB92994.1 hypothetical protein A3197_19510 [Candidatus Thiodiazotropha endoloripes]MCG7937992.1 hypothetical protein [Candidatus Thiodiazotropha lotti]MCG8003421.1 hypothetical protein [Candidatus Thiodiazotropha lotti]MCW4187042.1 hypothetical protein [Candidatus Thiodiazotropha lotti]
MRSEQLTPTNSDMDSDATEASGWRSQLMQKFEISTLMRLLGGGITFVAIVMFLFQRWDDATDLLRYSMIMGETILLTILGLATSIWLKEQKSARVFLGLSLVSTSAVFTILGAMIYSQIQWLPVDAHLPDYARWVADSSQSLFWLLSGSLVILVAQSMFSFSVLARPAARRLTLLMMLNVILLILPTREMWITTLLLLPALMFGHRYLTKLRASMPAMRTTEGVMASLLVMLPLIIMIGRGAYLYAADAFTFTTLALLGYLILRQLALSLKVMIRFRQSLEVLSLLPALLAAFSFTFLLYDIAPETGNWLVVAFGMTLSGFLFDLSKRAISGRNHYFTSIFYSGLIIAVIEIAFWPGLSTALFATLLSGLILLYSYSTKENNLLRFSLLTLIGSVILLVNTLFVSFDMSIWITLALLGMSIIVMAAVVEHYGNQIMTLIQRLKA